MKAFCIFDDFSASCIQQLTESGIEVTVLEKGKARPTDEEMHLIFQEYDIVIIGTSQKIHQWMWKNVTAPRIVATASVGIDHIAVPMEKRDLLTILNTPNANAQSVAEFTVGAMLMARKRYNEGNSLYQAGKNNKALGRKPEDICGAVVGLVGAGHISRKIIELLSAFGVRFLCYTKNPEKHEDLTERFDVKFVDLHELAEQSDIISVNVPNDASTANMIDRDTIAKMKNECIFISVSRASVVDVEALIMKAEKHSDFYVTLDLDIIPDLVGKSNGRNIVFTPHIAGGTIEARKRMFKEITESICKNIIG